MVYPLLSMLPSAAQGRSQFWITASCMVASICSRSLNSTAFYGRNGNNRLKLRHLAHCNFYHRNGFWKANFLSFTGRLILVNSVLLTSLWLYRMSLFRLLDWVSQKIDLYCRSFLWSEASTTSGLFL